MQRNLNCGVRWVVLCVCCVGLILCSLPASAAPATSSFTPGWDLFGFPLDYVNSSVSYSSPSSNSLDIMFHLVGADPNASHDVGIHQFLPASVPDCNLVTFGQFAGTPGCGVIARQGVTAYVTSFEFGTLNTDSFGNGDFNVLVTGIAPGVYNLEFTVREGPTCPGLCGVIYQSPGPIFGDTVTVSFTPEPSSLVLFGTAALGAIGIVRRKFRI
jgi:hypothetical protein